MQNETLSERVFTKLKDDILSGAYVPGERLLYEKAFETGSLFDTELTPEQESGLREEVVCDFWRRHFYPAPLELLSYARTLKLGPEYFLKTACPTRRHWRK